MLLLGAMPAHAERACAPWPGEFDPLPTVSDADPLRARWARLRAEQLAARAEELEPQDPVEANRLWQRVLCLDPGSASAHTGIERSRPAVVLRARPPRARPVVRAERPDPPAPPR
ncbi:MAG: hypothetical protein DCC71_25100, partial [Proteobacteria bacterium]